MEWRAVFGAAMGLCVALSPLTGRAQDFNRIIVFGDSLSDNGNLFASTGGTLPPSPPYVDGRFSNGPVWVELLALALTGDPLGSPFQGDAIAGNVDLAFGGAHAAGVLQTPPSILDQIGAFGLFGGQINPDNLVTVWAGANDLFDDLGAAQTAAQAQIVNVAVLTNLDARTLLVANLPDLGRTPRYLNEPNPETATQAAETFNATLESGLKAFARSAPPGVNIIQMDVFAAFNVVLSNPAAFGFTNVTDQCVTDSACMAASQRIQNQFLFWDNVHPTARGHELLADYARLLLSTETLARTVAPLAEVGLHSRLDASQAAFDRSVSALLLPPGRRSGLYAEAAGGQLDHDGSALAPSYRYRLYGVRAGLQYGIDDAVIGGSLGYLTGDLDQAALEADVGTIQADLYGAVSVAPFFIGLDAGLSRTDYDDIARQTGFPTVIARGDTGSLDYSAATSVGLVLDTGAVKLIPAGRLGYVNTRLDGFGESAPLLALDYGERDVSAGFWSASLRIAGAFPEAAMPVFGFVELGYEDFFAIDAGDVTAKLADNTALAESAAIDDPQARGFFVKLGVDAVIDEGTTFSLGYGLSLRDGEGESHTGRAQLKFLLGG